MDRNKLLSVKGIEKSYGTKKVLNNISFDLFEGDILGLLGPNGAGKSTIIKMLVGMVGIDAGEIQICGKNPMTDFCEAMKHIGAIVELPALYTNMSGRKNLNLCAKIHSIEKENQNIEKIIQTLEISEYIDDKVATYSLGMKQRLGLAMVLIGNPQVIILDEPTNGLDPNGIRKLREYLKKIVKSLGVSIIVSSHILSEIESLCNKVFMIHQGTCIVYGEMNDVLQKYQNKYRYRFVVPNWKQYQAINSLKDIYVMGMEDKDFLEFLVTKEEFWKLLCTFVKNNITVDSIELMNVTSLEDVFTDLTGGDYEEHNSVISG